MRLGRGVAVVLAVWATGAEAAGPLWHRSVAIDYQVAPDGQSVATEVWEVRADTASVAHTIAQQTFSATADMEETQLLDAYTQKADGTRIPVRHEAVLPQAVTTIASAPQFSATTSRTIVFPAVSAGDTVHYALRRKSKETMFPGAFTLTLEAGNWFSTEKADISVALPPGMTLQAEATGFEEAPAEPDNAGGTVRRWRRAAASAGQMTLDLSGFADYAALGRAYAARALPQSRPGPGVQALADRLSAGAVGKREIARRLYRYVAGEIRYVAEFLGNGRVVPRAAETVLEEGWGDCKDHSALLQALLAAEGIAAQPALITLRDRYSLPEAPGLGILDHVITYIPELDLYVDSTAPYAPFGTLLASEYDKPVVLADPVAARVARTPTMQAGAMMLATRTRARIGDDDVVSGETTTEAAGPQGIALRSMAAWFEGRGTAYSASSQLQQAGTPGMGRYRFDPPEVMNDDYRVDGRFALDEPLLDGGAAPFPIPGGLGVFGRPGRVLLNTGLTEDGGHICYPGSEVEETVLELPPGAQLRSMPRDVDEAAGGARYSARYRMEDGVLEVRREFSVETSRERCGPAEFAPMRAVLAAARRDQATQISLVRGGPERVAHRD